MKKILVLIVTLFTFHSLSAQYFKSDFTFGGGATFLYGDIGGFKPKAAPAGFIRYAVSPKQGFAVGIDIQGGLLESRYDSLSGGAVYSTSPRVSNQYFSGTVDLRIKPFQLFYDCDDRFQQSVSTVILKSIYVGVGIGGIVNNVDFRGDQNYFTSINSDTTSLALIIPLNLGLDIPLQKQNRTAKKAYFLNLNGQLNLSNNDWIDGLDPIDELNEKKDAYTFFSLGFVMKFN